MLNAPAGHPSLTSPKTRGTGGQLIRAWQKICAILHSTLRRCSCLCRRSLNKSCICPCWKKNTSEGIRRLNVVRHFAEQRGPLERFKSICDFPWLIIPLRTCALPFTSVMATLGNSAGRSLKLSHVSPPCR